MRVFKSLSLEHIKMLSNNVLSTCWLKSDIGTFGGEYKIEFYEGWYTKKWSMWMRN